MKQLYSVDALREELKHILKFTFIELDFDGTPQFFSQLVGHFWFCVELNKTGDGYRGSIVINEDGDEKPDPDNLIEIFNFDSMTAMGAFGGCARFSNNYFASIERRRLLAEDKAQQAENYMVKFGGISGRQRSLIKHCQEEFDVMFHGTTKEDADIFLDRYAGRLKK